MNTNYDELKVMLEKHKQKHLLHFWNELDDVGKRKLSGAINSIDFEEITKLSKLINHDVKIEKNIEQASYIPFSQNDTSNSFYKKMHNLGEELLKQGKVAAFVVAGGQGTRLGYNAPKGAYPIGPITKNSLFQFHFEKLMALQKKYKADIPFLIMTSEMTHHDTIEYLTKKDFFGYNKKNVFIFQQGRMPAMDKNGKILLAEKGYPAFSPNGHGGSIFALKDSGLFSELIQREIEYLFYFQVDNILVNICEPYFLGCHINNNSDISLKVLEKTYPEEKMGVFVINNKKACIIEYSDLSKEEMYEKDNKGKIKYRLGSPAVHIFKISFLKNFTDKYKNLPYHKAVKKVRYINEKGKHINPDEPNGVKFEMFIFDILPYSSPDKVIAVECLREREFAPLKNKEGKDSIQTVHTLYMNECSRLLENLGFKNLPRDASGNLIYKIEISPYLTTFKEELKNKVSDIIIDKDIYIS